MLDSITNNIIDGGAFDITSSGDVSNCVTPSDHVITEIILRLQERLSGQDVSLSYAKNTVWLHRTIGHSANHASVVNLGRRLVKAARIRPDTKVEFWQFDEDEEGGPDEVCMWDISVPLNGYDMFSPVTISDVAERLLAI